MSSALSFPTPSLDHLTADDKELVYDPAEDSFILLDALEQDAEELRAGPPGRVVVDIGSGSGIAGTFAGFILGGSSALYISTDINPRASQVTALTGAENKIPLQPIRTSLVGSLLPRLRQRIDLLLFNPPYVPTTLAEMDDTQRRPGLGSTWAGGADGMHVTEFLLSQLLELLSPQGVLYLVAIRQNKPLEILEALRRTTGGQLDGKVALQRRAGGEHLFVLKIWRTGGGAQQLR